MFKTRVTELFGIEHPLVQGGLQGVGKAELVSAVANAGALGFLTALTQPTPEDLVKEIQRTRDMTDKPFGVNLTILPTLTPVPYEEYARAAVESDVRIIETAGRNPEPFMPIFKEAGAKTLHKCTSVRHGLKAQSIGCDAVGIDGLECAGHPGEDDVPGLVLLPTSADQIDIPIVASGGFADARGLVAALALGADAINMGSRMVATREAPVHDNVKQFMVQCSERDTVLIFRKLRNTARILKNSVAERIREVETSNPDHTIEDLIEYVSGEKSRQVLETGDLDHGIIWGGQTVGLIQDIPTVKELIDRIILEAADIVNHRLGTLTPAAPRRATA
ncbi:MAG: nitronate monooxygenase family protein [Rhodospirillaceae bacterium]|nr:nitronate monooxygenase family protein [Rhodospirillaceae bacterium]